MHLGARGFVHAELIDPDDRRGARAERRRDGRARAHAPAPPRGAAAALPHARPRRRPDSPCACGRTAPRVRCLGRTDDMLIVRGVNVFPSAVREVVGGFAPEVSGHILVRPRPPGVKQEPPLPVAVELSRDGAADDELAGAIRDAAARRARRPGRGRARAVGQLAPQRVQVQTGGPVMEAPEPGRPPHHARRRGPADVDRLLGGRPRDAVRLRAAEPRQRRRRATSTSIPATAG